MCTIVTRAPSIVPATPAACSTSSAPGCAAATSTLPAAPGAIPAPSSSPRKPGLTSVRRCATTWPSNPSPATVIGQLSAALDAAWRRTATGYTANPDLRIEHRKGRDEIVLTPLDADPEPASLVTLRGEVERLLPEVEIADLPLEVHGWAGFLDEYTHMADAETREPGLPETLSALLVSERLQRRAHPGRRRNLPASFPCTAELGRTQLPALGDPRRRERPAGRLPHAPPAGPSLGRRGDGLSRRDAVRHPLLPPSTPPTTRATSAASADPPCILGWPTRTPSSPRS